MKNSSLSHPAPGPVEIRPGVLCRQWYQYRSKVLDYDRSFFDFFFSYVRVYNSERGVYYWEIDIIQLPNYRGRRTDAYIIHTLPSERGGKKICVAAGHEPRTESDALRLSMSWGDLQAEYIKTGVTPDQQIARNHR